MLAPFKRDRALRDFRRVVRGVLRGAAARLRTEHEDHRAGLALGHLADHRLSAEERAEGVHLELEIEILFGDFGEFLAQVRAGIVDQDRDRSEFALDGFDRRDYLLAARYVGRRDDGLAALGAD